MACLINLLNNGVDGVDGFDGVNGVFDNLPLFYDKNYAGIILRHVEMKEPISKINRVLPKMKKVDNYTKWYGIGQVLGWCYAISTFLLAQPWIYDR